MTPEEIQIKRDEYLKRLSAIAKEKKITQEALAAETGMTQSTINRMFSGKLSPTLDSLIVVANALEVEISLSNLH